MCDFTGMKTSTKKTGEINLKKAAKLIKLGYKQANDYDQGITQGDANRVDKFSTSRYKLVPRKSNRHHTVWKDTKDGNRRIINFTGTNVRKSEDLVSDLAIATGTEKYNRRFQRSRNLVEKIRKKDPSKRPTLVSHSLGGTLNEYAARGDPKIKQVNYNKGAGLGTIFRKGQKNQVDIRTRGDAVSFLDRLARPGKARKLEISRPTKGPLDAHNVNHLRSFGQSTNKVV